MVRTLLGTVSSLLTVGYEKMAVIRHAVPNFEQSSVKKGVRHPVNIGAVKGCRSEWKIGLSISAGRIDLASFLTRRVHCIINSRELRVYLQIHEFR